MPVFLITYTSARQHHDIHHETEWITPGNYDQDRAREAFEREFPTASIVRCEEVT
jgi:hypothetical protein